MWLAGARLRVGKSKVLARASSHAREQLRRPRDSSAPASVVRCGTQDACLLQQILRAVSLRTFFVMDPAEVLKKTGCANGSKWPIRGQNSFEQRNNFNYLYHFSPAFGNTKRLTASIEEQFQEAPWSHKGLEFCRRTISTRSIPMNAPPTTIFVERGKLSNFVYCEGPHLYQCANNVQLSFSPFSIIHDT